MAKTDLIERLRALAPANSNGAEWSLMDEAADRIKELEACIEGARAILDRNELLSVDWPATDWEDVMVMLADPYRTEKEEFSDGR